jgi:hypothetical protein
MIWFQLVASLALLSVGLVDSAIASAGPTIYGPNVEIALSWGYVCITTKIVFLFNVPSL